MQPRVLEKRGESVSNLLDAIETVLQARVLCYQRTGQILTGLSGWENAAGLFKDGKTIYDLYKKKTGRTQSHARLPEGAVGLGGAPPDGLVYLDEVLAFYVAHRPPKDSFTRTRDSQVLERTPDARLRLTPQEAGSYLRVEQPSDPSVAFTIWAPEWTTVPALGYSQEEFGGMKLDWKRDEATGAVGCTIDRPEATFSAEFIPHLDYIEKCLCTCGPSLKRT